MNAQQIAHAWAHQIKTSARSGNFWIEGTVIGHYATWMGTIMQSEGGMVYVLNSRSYSNLTAKFQSAIRRAVPGGHIVYIEGGDRGCRAPRDWDAIVDMATDRLRRSIDSVSQLTMKTPAKIDHAEWGFINASRMLQMAMSYKLGKSFRPSMASKLERSLTGLSTKATWKQAEELLTSTRQARADRNSAVSNRRIVSDVRRNERLRDYESKWRAGEINRVPYNMPFIMLRIRRGEEGVFMGPYNIKSGEIVETSRGAAVPLSHAIRAYKIYLRAEGLKGEAIGHFSINEEPTDTIKIGCHEIRMTEIAATLDPLINDEPAITADGA